MSEDRWPERALDALMDYGPMLPLTLCAEHSDRAVRMLGLLWYLVWVLPAMLLCAAPLLFLLGATIVVEMWHGD